MQLYAKMARECDIIITTALIPNRPAPICITGEMILSMKRGSVIVDMAVVNGGNVEGSAIDQEVYTMNGVAIIGKSNYPSEMATQASEFLARNFHAFLEVLGDFKAARADKSGRQNGGEEINLEDVILRDSIIQYRGAIMYPPPPRPREVSIKMPSAAELNRDGSSATDIESQMEAQATPGMVAFVIQWLNDNKDELAMGLGLGVILALGL